MYFVEWAPSALGELASIWADADSVGRADITAAAREADSILGGDPELAGESRPGRQRILFVAPLGMTFKVQARIRLVRVVEVWQFRKRGR